MLSVCFSNNETLKMNTVKTVVYLIHFDRYRCYKHLQTVPGGRESPEFREVLDAYAVLTGRRSSEQLICWKFLATVRTTEICTNTMLHKAQVPVDRLLIPSHLGIPCMVPMRMRTGK